MSWRAEPGADKIGRPLARIRLEANAGAEEDRIRPARAVVVDITQPLFDKPVAVRHFTMSTTCATPEATDDRGRREPISDGESPTTGAPLRATVQKFVEERPA
jgi:hypothetical protein